MEAGRALLQRIANNREATLHAAVEDGWLQFVVRALRHADSQDVDELSCGGFVVCESTTEIRRLMITLLCWENLAHVRLLSRWRGVFCVEKWLFVHCSLLKRIA